MKTITMIGFLIMGTSASVYAFDLKDPNIKESESVLPQKKSNQDDKKISDLIKKEDCKQTENTYEDECVKLKDQ